MRHEGSPVEANQPMTKDHESESYDRAILTFGGALKELQGGNFKKAKDMFTEVLGVLKDEPVVAERTRMYLAVCERRLTEPEKLGSTPHDLYYRAVVESNNGNSAEAISLLDQALQQTPNSAKLLYARASAWALSANPDSAVNDLRQAIAIDPTIRFQAVNDSDFERIREEPGFIDIIEPTPAGA